MVRSNWVNLNGLWSFALAPADFGPPNEFNGEILVPFCIESALSGVGRNIGTGQALWYSRNFSIPDLSKNERLLLHFDAVDWESKVIVNGHTVGEHRGGYDPFTFDITDYLVRAPRQVLTVRVIDSTDSYQPRGKQSLRPSGIFYTATSGIWQTVWLETVPSNYIRALKISPDIDKGLVTVSVRMPGTEQAQIKVLDEAGREIASRTGPVNTDVAIKVPDPRYWSPDDPYLYSLKILAGSDLVTSYFGMRKIERRADQTGAYRFFLNNQPIFLSGPLDQGFWPDGISTAPNDEALRFDLETSKRFGFNVVRKHVKVEPERWYYWADRLGLLVWQDFPSVMDVLLDRGAADLTRSNEAKQQIETEMQLMVECHWNHPCIIMWVSFNEGWGQYDTARVVGLFKSWDSSRLIDNASGWIDRNVGDVLDLHSYPAPSKFPKNASRIVVQGEYGGGGLLVPGHD
ncbi:MAG: glycoside hydrolase family 2, partial [Verrucomicrobia bacterium]|nr:glycoside hydrolase family 2 [Verrucomicrobiota bacterium]